MRSRQERFHIFLLVIAFFCVIALVTPCMGAAAITLDKVSVFCAYYKLSGDFMNDQDVEDLCVALGKPTFSHYKPSELFTKRTLLETRNTLLETMELIDETSTFKWNTTYTFTGRRQKPHLDYDNILPHPTPFIAAKISLKGQTDINTRLAQAIDALQLEKSTIVTISVYLKPQHVYNRFEERNIGRHNVFFPHRRIVFHPVKIAVTLEDNIRKLPPSDNTQQ